MANSLSVHSQTVVYVIIIMIMNSISSHDAHVWAINMHFRGVAYWLIRDAYIHANLNCSINIR